MKAIVQTTYELKYNREDEDLANVVRITSESIGILDTYDPVFLSLRTAENFCRAALLSMMNKSNHPGYCTWGRKEDATAALQEVPKDAEYRYDYEFSGPPEVHFDRSDLLCRAQRPARLRIHAAVKTRHVITVDGKDYVREEVTKTTSSWYPATAYTEQIAILRKTRQVVK
jgi:hypothetical protein